MPYKSFVPGAGVFVPENTLQLSQIFEDKVLQWDRPEV